MRPKLKYCDWDCYPIASHLIPLFKFNHILKYEGKIVIENITLISKSIKNLMSPIFKEWSTFCLNIPIFYW